MRRRTQARDYALKILYQSDITKKSVVEILKEFEADERNKDGEVQEFCERLVSGVQSHLREIDVKISQCAANWDLKRMAIIDRNILRLGVFELHYASDIPPKVTINEAVELAKKYGDLESGKFVNGILDKIHRNEINSSEKTS